MTGRHWVAILGAAAARAALRAELREVALPEGAMSPSPGDRVAVVTLPAVALVGVATVARIRPEGRTLHLRDRSRAPAGHAVDLLALRPRPSFAVPWTRERLADLAGTYVPIGERDASRITDALRARALEFGPPAKRPAHAKARSPGRRALIQGRAASGRLRAR